MSPGMLSSHYAPHTPTMLVAREDIADALEDAREDGASCVVLSHALAADVNPPHELIAMPAGAHAYAAALYESLRRADDRAADLILVEEPPRPESAESASDAAVWRAVWDRVVRAAGRGR